MAPHIWPPRGSDERDSWRIARVLLTVSSLATSDWGLEARSIRHDIESTCPRAGFSDEGARNSDDLQPLACTVHNPGL
jgi:hypothetical protein